MLSFAEAKPRNASALEYEEKDEFRLADFMERFVHGELRFDADYIRGRRIKTRIVVRSNGEATLETVGRGKAALRWARAAAREEADASCRSVRPLHWGLRA